MAWLQNLAGRAEDLLNKIDQNAATVLSEAHSKPFDKVEIIINPSNDLESSPTKAGISTSSSTNSLKFVSKNINSSPTKQLLELQSELENDELTIDVEEKERLLVLSSETNQEELFEKPYKSDKSSVSSKSSSVPNSFNLAEEANYFNERIAKLEFENQDLHKQLLNLQHLYSELWNENTNLQYQLERSCEQVNAALLEKEQYIARAQRILQEKEKLISLKHGDSSNDENGKMLVSYNDQLKGELQFQQEKNKEINEKYQNVLNDIHLLQMQHQVIQNGLQQSHQSLEESLLNEKKFRKVAEEEYQLKMKELLLKDEELQKINEIIISKDIKIEQLKAALKQKSNISFNEDLEARIQSLTETLMMKQNKLETVTTERNALRLQIEKLENEYQKNLAQYQKAQTKVVHISDTNDMRTQVPQFMRVSPRDAGVTRRVKHAYSTVDSISIRTGIFLRRYPVARVFVFCYMVILHIWVLIILFLYVPSNR